jgi:outer membrane protein TolC
MTNRENTMLKSAFINSLLFLTCLLTLCACAAGIKQDYSALADQKQVQVTEWRTLDNGQQVNILGDLIGSADLESLVDEALRANPGLQQTLLTLQIRQAEYRRTSGEKWPQATAGFTASREEDSKESIFTGSATVSWELDL